MKERGILFSGPMIRALLAGQKTQTRRLVKPQPGDHFKSFGELPTCKCHRFGFHDNERHYPSPYGQPGDRLWVRETWAIPPGSDAPREVAYRADFGKITTEDDRREGRTWSPSIHMPRRFSRITLEITEVRVERLHAITEEDAKAEGVDPSDQSYCPLLAESYRGAFEAIWDYINGDRAPWHSNPWVWVVAFRRLP